MTVWVVFPWPCHVERHYNGARAAHNHPPGGKWRPRVFGRTGKASPSSCLECMMATSSLSRRAGPHAMGAEFAYTLAQPEVPVPDTIQITPARTAAVESASHPLEPL